jgi:hypothetical protein
MTVDMWKRKIGDNAWKHIMSSDDIDPGGVVEQMVAGILDRAVECGWQAPEKQPMIDPAGTKVLWPGEVPVMTAEGLVRYYQRQGNHYLILKIGPLLRGVGQFLLPRLQEVMAAYESQCSDEGFDPLPVVDCIFVGCKSNDLGDLLKLRHGAPRARKPTDSASFSG